MSKQREVVMGKVYDENYKVLDVYMGSYTFTTDLGRFRARKWQFDRMQLQAMREQPQFKMVDLHTIAQFPA
jgi:hypothetical protein